MIDKWGRSERLAATVARRLDEPRRPTDSPELLAARRRALNVSLPVPIRRPARPR